MSPTLSEWMNMAFRWIHVVAGIIWIGHLYFFNFVNSRVMPALDGDVKRKVVPELLPRALYWFRWAALWTWVTGILLLGLVYSMGGALVEGDSAWSPGNATLLAFAQGLARLLELREDDRIVEECGGADPATTNNRMELMAMIAGLRMLPADSKTTLYSDSNLCVQTVNQWAAGWERRGWRRKGGPIANLELVKELWELAQARPTVTVQWIKAHDGSRWNEYADAIATEQAASN